MSGEYHERDEIIGDLNAIRSALTKRLGRCPDEIELTKHLTVLFGVSLGVSAAVLRRDVNFIDHIIAAARDCAVQVHLCGLASGEEEE